MKMKLMMIICCLSFSLMASAQASGGQITRKKPKSTSNTQRVYKSKEVKPEIVDLGLPSGTLWADRNVGASSSTVYGGLYRYGAPHTRADGSNSEVCSLPNIVGTNFDVAMVNLGSNWRLPTKEQVQELLNFCQVTKEVVNRIKVAKFVGPNGNFILLPFAGVMYNYGRSQAGDFGIYMIAEKACYFDLGENIKVVSNRSVMSMEWGESVRAVYNNTKELK